MPTLLADKVELTLTNRSSNLFNAHPVHRQLRLALRQLLHVRVHRAARHPEHAGLLLLQQPRLEEHRRALHARGELGDGDGDARAAPQQRL